MVTTFDKKGKELKRDIRRLKAMAPSNVAPTGRIDVPLNLPYKLEADAKAVRARFVVRVEATGRMGTADLMLGQAGAVAKSQSVAPASTAAPPPQPAAAQTTPTPNP